MTSAALQVVGLSGLPVQGGAGLKPPVFLRSDGRYFAGDPDAPRSTHDRTELEELERRGLLCLFPPKERHRVAEGVVLYAHEDFIEPVRGSLDLRPWLVDLEDLRSTIHAYVAYMRRDQALERMRAWAHVLLRDAEEHLSRGSAALALASLDRARFVTPVGDFRDERRKLFVLRGAAFLLGGRDMEALRRNARFDFQPAEVDEIARMAEVEHRILIRRPLGLVVHERRVPRTVGREAA